MKRLSKKGTYLVEAAVVLPLFLMMMTALASLIPLFSTCGNIAFSMADEVRFECAKSAFLKEPAALPAAAHARIRSENPGLSGFRITAYARDREEQGIGDLISISFRSEISGKSMLLPAGDVSFSGTVTGRAFTGATHEVTEGGDAVVYVFPERGEKYHGKGCRYLASHCRMTFLSDEVKAEYRPCPLCGAKRAENGTPVFCFDASGEAYHTGTCRSVEKDKYYTETTKAQAEQAGYTPCSVCGGD